VSDPIPSLHGNPAPQPPRHSQRGGGSFGAHGPLRALWLARLLSALGNSLGTVALLLLTATTTGNGFAVAALLIVSDFAPNSISPLTGALSDRLDRRQVLIICEWLAGLGIAAIALAPPLLPIILLLVGVRSTASQLAVTTARGAVPALVAPQDLEHANAALGVGTNAMGGGGPLLAAALLPFVSFTGLLLIAAGIAVLAGLVVLRLPSLPGTRKHQAPSLLREARAGMAIIWRHTALRVLALGFVAVVVFTAVDDVALVFLARDTLRVSASATSVLYAGVDVGLLLGYALLTRWAKALPLAALLILGYLCSSAGNVATGLAWVLAVAFVTQVGRGLGLSLTELANTTLLQRLVPPDLLGRVFANIYGAVGLAASLSYVLGGALLQATNPRITFVIAGAGGILAACVLALALPRALATSMMTPAAS
jgi:MFS family permease